MSKHKSENQETIEKVKELIEDVEVTMLATISGSKIVSRPMQTQEVEFDGDLWFLTEKDTDKYQEISINPAVNLSYVGKSYVSISGNAEFVEDYEKKKEFWNPVLGRVLGTSVDDPNVVLVKVVPETAEYWESGVNIKTVKEFAKKIAKKDSLEDKNDLNHTAYFDENAKK